MTTPNPMLAELDEVVRLMEAATTRDWEAARGCVYGPDPGPPHYPEVIADCGMGAEAAPRADTIAAAVNFLRTHHATLADMAKRLEAAERDARRYRWLRGLDSQFMLKKYGCGDLPVDEDLDAEIDDAIAATQEGEG